MEYDYLILIFTNKLYVGLPLRILLPMEGDAKENQYSLVISLCQFNANLSFSRSSQRGTNDLP
jgi:hypothetical protein